MQSAQTSALGIWGTLVTVSSSHNILTSFLYRAHYYASMLGGKWPDLCTLNYEQWSPGSGVSKEEGGQYALCDGSVCKLFSSSLSGINSLSWVGKE